MFRASRMVRMHPFVGKTFKDYSFTMDLMLNRQIWFHMNELSILQMNRPIVSICKTIWIFQTIHRWLIRFVSLCLSWSPLGIGFVWFAFGFRAQCDKASWTICSTLKAEANTNRFNQPELPSPLIKVLIEPDLLNPWAHGCVTWHILLSSHSMLIILRSNILLRG